MPVKPTGPSIGKCGNCPLGGPLIRKHRMQDEFMVKITWFVRKFGTMIDKSPDSNNGGTYILGVTNNGTT